MEVSEVPTCIERVFLAMKQQAPFAVSMRQVAASGAVVALVSKMIPLAGELCNG